jgi:hypothetical protein
MKKEIIGLCAAVVICSASVAQAQGHHGGGGWGGGGWWAPAIVVVSSPVLWLLRIMPPPILLCTMRRRHRPMGRGGGVTPRSLITTTHRLAPAGSEPFSHGETETKTGIDDISVSFAFPRECFKFCFQSPHAWTLPEPAPSPLPVRNAIPPSGMLQRSVVMANCRYHGAI